MKHPPDSWNKERNTDETFSLKSVACKALERLQRNKAETSSETNPCKHVSVPPSDETKKKCLREPLCLQQEYLRDSYEERLAIAEYDGQQSDTQSRRIAYLDAFISVLSVLPYNDTEESQGKDWLDERMKATKELLLAQGFRQPE